jgi:hypothetical protein
MTSLEYAVVGTVSFSSVNGVLDAGFLKVSTQLGQFIDIPGSLETSVHVSKPSRVHLAALNPKFYKLMLHTLLNQSPALAMSCLHAHGNYKLNPKRCLQLWQLSSTI